MYPAARHLVAHRFLLLSVAVALVLASAWYARQLQFDRSIENMFAADNQLVHDYARLKRTFGGNEIVLLVYDDPELFNEDGQGIARVTQVRRRLESIAGIKGVLSIDQPLHGDWVVRDNPLARRTRELFEGFTHGQDGRTVALVCMLQTEAETDVPRSETVEQMRQIVDSLPDPLGQGYLTGEPVLLVDGFNSVEADGRRLGRWSAILLGLTIVLCFRSLRWVIIPIAVVQFALLTTKAILAVGQLRFSMVSSTLTAVVMVIGVATMMHIVVNYRRLRGEGLTAEEALSQTLTLLAGPITWACLTDAAGFAALLVSEVGPVRDFGLAMAIGSMMIWLAVALIVPGLALLGRVDVDPHLAWGESRLVLELRRLLVLVERRPGVWAVAILSVTLFFVSGLRWLELESDFTRNFRASSEIARSYSYVEEHLGGAGVCDIILPAPRTLDWPYLERVASLSEEIHALVERESSLTKSFCVADALRQLSPVPIESQPSLLRGGFVRSSLAAMQGWMPEFYGALHGVDPETGASAMRVMLRVHERQSSADKQRLIGQLREISQRHFPEAVVTGHFVLLGSLIESILHDQWLTFLVALIGIGVLMTVAFRSLRLALIALVPNVLPVLIVLGGMGWLSRFVWPELKINMGTAMIATVSLGLSIDSSIHYLIAFRRAVLDGMHVMPALWQVQQNVGRAMFFSTIALMVGFAVLATSDFLPTVYFGALAGLSMLGGLIGNLVLLPLLLYWFWPRRSEVV